MTYRIVVGFDGSPHSRAALRWALGEGVSRDGEVIAVFCWQMPFLSIPGAFDRDELQSVYKAFMNTAAAEVAPAPEVPLRMLVAEGDTTQSLIAAVEQEDARLLVLGTRGRSPVTGLLLGSVSQACAAAAPCPVVLVKTAHPS